MANLKKAIAIVVVTFLASLGLSAPAAAEEVIDYYAQAQARQANWDLSGHSVVIYNSLDSGELVFKNKNSGKFLTQTNYGLDDTERNVEVAAGGDQYDRNWGFTWVLRPAGDDYWYIVNLTSGLYLTWDGDDRNVSAWGLCCGGENQKWSFVQNPDNTVMIVNKATGEALGQADGGRRSDKNNVTIWPGQNAKDGGWSWTPKIVFPTLSRLRVMTIDSVKAISTSTGQDDATKVLFAGIDLAIQIGAAAASGGASAAADAGGMITREALVAAAKAAAKDAAKEGVRDLLIDQARSGLRITNEDLARAGVDPNSADGIDLAIQIAAAAAGGGKSAAKDTAKQAAIDKARERLGVTNEDLARAGIDRYSAAGGRGGQAATAALDTAASVLDAMSSEYIFNKIYGSSPDDLDIRVNKSSIFPKGGRTRGETIKSQQTLQVGRSYIFYADTGAALSLWEYDYASRDDFMGGVVWKDPSAIARRSDLQKQDWRTLDLFQTQTYKDVLITEESEGSAYLVTFHIDALRPVGGQLEELKSQRDPTRRGPNYDALLARLQARANPANGPAGPQGGQQDGGSGNAVQPAGPAAPGPAAGAAGSCGERGRIKSVTYVPATLVQTNFANSGQTNLTVYWIDDSGKEGNYQRQPQPLLTLAPGQMQGVQAYYGFAFAIVDQDGTCVAVAKSTAGGDNFSFAGVGGGTQVASADPGTVRNDATGGAAGPRHTTAQDYARAGGKTCDLEGKVVSINEPKPGGVDLHLQNGGQGYLFVYWIYENGQEGNLDRQPQPLVNLTPGQYVTIQTTEGQAYMVRDQNGACVGIVQANMAQTNFTF